jgi:hypothetical protein
MQSEADIGEFRLCMATAVSCALLHLATFVTIVPFFTIVVPGFMIVSASMRSRANQPQGGYRTPSGMLGLLGIVLFGYAMFTAILFWMDTGAPIGVGIVEGQYVAKFKYQITKPISEQEYRMIPNVWVRILSALLGSMAVFGLARYREMQKSARENWTRHNWRGDDW